MNKGILKIGDQVEVIDEDLKGAVTGVNGDLVTIETEDGFQLNFSILDLIKISADEALKIAPVFVPEEADNKREKSKGGRKKKEKPIEVDLHIHNLREKIKGLTKHEILQIQLTTVKNTLDKAIRKRQRKLIFIHGVGAGVLKSKLYELLKEYENLSYYDAEYSKYGFGATEVRLYFNS